MRLTYRGTPLLYSMNVGLIMSVTQRSVLPHWVPMADIHRTLNETFTGLYAPHATFQWSCMMSWSPYHHQMECPMTL
jgi:hypothetical protein